MNDESKHQIEPFLCLPPHSALQEAQEIFGGDFDFADFDADAYEQGDEEEEEPDKRQPKRMHGRKSIFELYEPIELETSHMTDQDNEIRSTDMPERFQVCGGGGGGGLVNRNLERVCETNHELFCSDIRYFLDVRRYWIACV